LPINEPGCPSSVRIITLKAVPTIAAQAPKIKYKVPMSLWLVEKNQRCGKMAEFRRQTVNLFMSVNSFASKGLYSLMKILNCKFRDAFS
jgi:hypothetical protein